MVKDTILVLLIEDNPGDARLVIELIKDVPNTNIIIEWVKNLTTGFEKLSNTLYDLILLDLSLPESTGLETFTKLNMKYSNIPIIILTGNENLELAINAVKSGAQDYLFKGIFSGELLVLSIHHSINRFNLLIQLKASQNKAEASEKKYRLILQTIPLGAVLIDKDFRILDWNRGCERIFGWKYDEVILKNLLSLLFLPPIESDLAQKIKNSAHNQINPCLLFENCDKSQRTHKCEWFSTEILDSSIDLSVIIVIINDISEKSRLQDVIASTQKMEAIGNLARGFAHDFNNILTIVKGYSETIQSTLEKNSPYAEPIQYILDASNHAKELVDQLFILSKNQPKVIKEININLLIKNLFESVLKVVIGQHISCKLNLDESIEAINIDPNQFTQIIMNLIINARDALEAKNEENFIKKIQINSKKLEVDEDFSQEHLLTNKGKYIFIEIFDNGIGMDKETISHLFEPFFTTKGKKGTGLGLSIVYSIISQYSGSIFVDSEVGKFTSFKIYLPVM